MLRVIPFQEKEFLKAVYRGALLHPYRSFSFDPNECPMRILVLNGPNLNLLGQRDSANYGKQGMEEILEELRSKHPSHDIEEIQSNHEGDLIDALHRADREKDGAILNAGGYTHSSIALGDAVEAIHIPVIEVHLSNILAREEFRHVSYIAPHSNGCIMGMGADGYEFAVQRLERIKGS